MGRAWISTGYLGCGCEYGNGYNLQDTSSWVNARFTKLRFTHTTCFLVCGDRAVHSGLNVVRTFHHLPRCAPRHGDARRSLRVGATLKLFPKAKCRYDR
eukprot:352893-Chlamydomonas_euryale.AAC.2